MKNILCLCFVHSLLLFTACNRDTDAMPECYNEEMVENHSGFCPSDCPGVCSCNGQTYCNSCVAARNGIEVISDGPCE